MKAKARLLRILCNEARLKHVRELAAGLDCEIWWWSKTGGLAVNHPETDIPLHICVPRPTTGFRYAICLHELGHIALGHEGAGWVAEEERMAWGWAWRTAKSKLWDGWSDRARKFCMDETILREAEEAEEAKGEATPT